MPVSSGAAGKPDKSNMSSRLLTMKFMQRAAATAASKEAQSPASDESPHTPKRQRKSMEHQSPSTPQADLDAIAAAIAAEEQKRQEVIARQAAEAGETHWVLDVPAANSPPPQPQSYVMATESLDVDDDISFGGRRGFGNFKRKVLAQTEEEKIAEQLEQLSPDDPRRAQAEKAMADLMRAKAQDARAPRLSEITSISGAGGRPQLMGAPSSSKKKKKRKSDH